MVVLVNPRTRVSVFLKLTKILVTKGTDIKSVSILNDKMIPDDYKTLKTLGISKNDLQLSVFDWLKKYRITVIPLYSEHKLKLDSGVDINMLVLK